MVACPAFDPLGPYVTGMVDFVDCHARALGQDGYRALGIGSPVGTAIGVLITIYIALIGYRILLGDVPRARDAVLAAARIGMVMTLATQWPAYQVLVYDVVVDEPAALAGRILAPGGLGGDDPAMLTAGIQASYDRLDKLIHPEVAPQPPAPTSRSVDAGAGAAVQFTAPPPIGGLTLNQTTQLASAESLLLAGALGGLLSTRIVAGVLLALGPLFAGLLLFEATMGLFVGWLRALIATVLGGVGVLAVLGLELAVLVPQIAALEQAVASNLTVPTLIGEIVATALVFAILTLAILIGGTVAALGLKVPGGVRVSVRNVVDQLAMPQALRPAIAGPVRITASFDGERSRAQGVADAIAAIDRREERIGADTSRSVRAAVSERLTASTARPPAEPIGQRGKRSTRRASSAARARDTQK